MTDRHSTWEVNTDVLNRSIQIEESWPLDQPRWKHPRDYKLLDFSYNPEDGSVDIWMTRSAGTDRDNYEVTEDVEMTLSREHAEALRDSLNQFLEGNK